MMGKVELAGKGTAGLDCSPWCTLSLRLGWTIELGQKRPSQERVPGYPIFFFSWIPAFSLPRTEL